MKFLYFIYCIVKTDINKFLHFLNYSSKFYNIGRIRLVADIIYCIIKFDTLPLDYFYYKFFEMPHSDRKKYTSRLLMYKFQKKFNKNEDRLIFRDKQQFIRIFKDYVKHKTWNLDEPENLDDFLSWIRLNLPVKIVLKDPSGQAGRAVQVIDLMYNNAQAFVESIPLHEFLKVRVVDGYSLGEAYIQQHNLFMQLYPGCLNTVRITSFLHTDGTVELLYAIIRIGFDKAVDNFDAGGISALIDINEGKVIKNGLFKHPFKSRSMDVHPITGFNILGLKIPFWNEILSLVESAARIVPTVRTVGWDVVITDNGPALLEGNDNWDKTHWECCENKGMKDKILSLYNIKD